MKKYKLELVEHEMFMLKDLYDSYKHLIKAVPGSYMGWLVEHIEEAEAILNNADEVEE